MRDPADTQSNPYDVLGLAVTATQKEINDALAPFLKDPAKKPRMREAMEARKRLTDPVERLAVDFFQYDVAGGEEEALLRAGRRAELSDRWEKARANRVGADPRIDHNLAVLTWWWAVAEESRVKPQDFKRVDDLWLRAIPNLTFVGYLPGYWEASQARLRGLGSTLAQGDDVTSAARRRVLDEAAVRMGAFATAAQEKRDQALVQRWSAIRTHFDVERTSTEDLAQLIREGFFKDLRPCGPLLAAMFNGREFVYSRLGGGEVPRERVAKLLGFFSPVGRAQHLVDEQRHDEALAALDALPKEAREKPDSQALYAAIHGARGKALAGHEESLEEGIQAFAKAAAHARRAPDDAKKRLADGAKDVAAAWINKAEYDSAIRLLEPLWDGLADISVRDLLVVAYCDRGSIRVIQGRDTKDSQILLDGLRDLETCIEYDRNYKKGGEYLDVAKRMLAEELAKNGYVDLSLQVVTAALSGARTDAKKLLEQIRGATPSKRAVLVTLTDKTATGGLSYSTPPLCACCADANPGEKRTINGERQSGNMKHTLSVNIPYCKECNEHANKEGSRFGWGCFTFIGIAVFFFAWLQNRIDPTIWEFGAKPVILSWSFWVLHVLAAICVSARVAKILVPVPKLSAKHSIADSAAWISSFYTGTMTLGFRNAAVGVAFAIANKGTTSEVKAT